MRALTHGQERSGRGALRAIALLTFLIALLAVPATAGAVAPGGINQLPNPLGCVSNGGAGNCTAFHDQSAVYDMVISPDGKNLYAAGYGSATISVYDRNQNTGGLTQKSGDKGCIKDGAATPTCRGASNLSGPLGMAMTPDGKTLYVASFFTNAVLTFTRAADGSLTQKPGAQGCMSNAGDGTTCRDARALNGPYYLALSADGKNLYAAAYSGSSVTGFAIDSTAGTLTQLGDGSGGSGCVENVPTADGCADGRALAGPFAMNVDPGGETIYPAAFTDASVSALARDPATGRLAPVSGATGCVDREGTDGCTTVGDLSTIRDLSGAPGNNQLYVAVEGTSRVLTFDRLDSGGLVPKSGDARCVSNGAVAGCRTGRGLESPAGIAATNDGDDVYVVSQQFNSGLVELDRDASGALSARPGTRGCIVAGSAADCATASNLSSMYDVKISPDNRFVYVSGLGSNTLGVFRRDSQGPTCSNGNRTVTQGTLTSLKLPCTDVDGDPVNFQIINPPTIGSLGAIDESTDSVGYAASQGQCGNTSFTFRGTSSGQTSPTRTFSLSVIGCSTGGGGGTTGGGGGGGGGGSTPQLIPSTVTNNWLAFPKFTTVTNLSISNLLAGSTVRITCKTRKKKQQKKGCPYKARRVTSAVPRTRLNLRKPYRRKRLPVGTKITITITVPGQIGKRFSYTMRARKLPRKSLRCIPPGGSPSRCV